MTGGAKGRASGPSSAVEPAAPGAVTALLHAWRGGDQGALERLLPQVYDELRRLAHLRLRRPGRDCTLQPTALVHEAFLRLVGHDVDWQSRAHFFALASQVMRRVAVDAWRARAAQKRGGGKVTVELTAVAEAAVEPRSVDLMALDDALTRLEAVSPLQARVVELRYFAGLSLEEAAAVLERSRASVFRDWRAAKAWLFSQLAVDGAREPDGR